ncbi:MAG TPA: hypothetical protein VGF23_04830 [Gaiellaceae bacterium]
MPGPIKAVTRRTGAIGMAITVYDIWRRLPPQQRQQLVGLARKHGPGVATRIAQTRRRPKP